MANHALKVVTGDCEFCSQTNVMLTQQHGDMMCNDCIARENAVVKSEKVIVESRQNDAKIQHKEDIYTAVTTSFIELHGAILNNPDITPEAKKFKLAEEATERIKVLDAAIFAKKQELANVEQERFGWIKNLQPLVATLRAEEQAKFKQFNLNYKPVDVTVTKIRKVAKSSKPAASGDKYSNKQIKEACDKAGADIVMVSMMMRSPSNQGCTLDQVIQKYLIKMAN